MATNLCGKCKFHTIQNGHEKYGKLVFFFLFFKYMRQTKGNGVAHLLVVTRENTE